MTVFKWLFRAFVVLATFAAILAGVIYHLITSPISISEEQRFNVSAGDTTYNIGYQLAKEGWIANPLLVRVVAKLHPEWVPKVGEYALMPNMTLLDVMSLFDSGKSIVYSVTLLEGKTLSDYLKAMSEKGNITMTLADLSPSDIAKKFGFDVSNPEGEFFANTYQYHKGETDFKILQQSHKLLEKPLDSLWEKREKDLPYKTPYDALIMASIIEKETGDPTERPLISRVFVSRLQKGIRLQTDPAVIYGLGKRFDGNLTRKDLRTETPYNTYMNYGLPPTPIANVGKEAIEAALNPGQTKALYFVAKGDGTHAFSETLAEHNRAVAKYQKYHRRADYTSSPEASAKETTK